MKIKEFIDKAQLPEWAWWVLLLFAAIT